MARKFFRRFMPSHDRVHSEKMLRIFRPILNKPYLWHLNRHSCARGVGIGMFWSLLPVMGQSIPAVLMTWKARGNVPLAIAATWLSNPFTLIPHWWSAYVIGKFVLRSKGIEDIEWNMAYWERKFATLHSSWEFISTNFWNFYAPLFVGSILEGIVCGLLGYVLVNGFWKYHTRRKWAQSRERARKLAADRKSETSSVSGKLAG